MLALIDSRDTVVKLDIYTTGLMSGEEFIGTATVKLKDLMMKGATSKARQVFKAVEVSEAVCHTRVLAALMHVLSPNHAGGHGRHALLHAGPD